MSINCHVKSALIVLSLAREVDGTVGQNSSERVRAWIGDRCFLTVV